MKIFRTLALGCCVATSTFSLSFAQETAATPAGIASTVVDTQPSVASVTDGVLRGKVFSDVEGVRKPLDAKITLSSEGVVLDTVKADEDGLFSFQGVEPGAYQLFGSADGFVGGETYDVQPHSGEAGGCSACNLSLQSDATPCSQTVYQAPASACSCNGGGLGGGRFGGGGLSGGRLGGGGLFSGRRLLALGVTGGVIAIATSDDDNDDMVSADN